MLGGGAGRPCATPPNTRATTQLWPQQCQGHLMRGTPTTGSCFLGSGGSVTYSSALHLAKQHLEEEVPWSSSSELPQAGANTYPHVHPPRD